MNLKRKAMAVVRTTGVLATVVNIGSVWVEPVGELALVCAAQAADPPKAILDPDKA